MKNNGKLTLEFSKTVVSFFLRNVIFFFLLLFKVIYIYCFHFYILLFFIAIADVSMRILHSDLLSSVTKLLVSTFDIRIEVSSLKSSLIIDLHFLCGPFQIHNCYYIPVGTLTCVTQCIELLKITIANTSS